MPSTPALHVRHALPQFEQRLFLSPTASKNVTDESFAPLDARLFAIAIRWFEVERMPVVLGVKNESFDVVALHEIRWISLGERGRCNDR